PVFASPHTSMSGPCPDKPENCRATKIRPFTQTSAERIWDRPDTTIHVQRVVPVAASTAASVSPWPLEGNGVSKSVVAPETGASSGFPPMVTCGSAPPRIGSANRNMTLSPVLTISGETRKGGDDDFDRDFFATAELG